MEQNELGCGKLRWFCGRYGGWPRQRCHNAKILMETNDFGTYVDGWWMSIATQQAKERENRTPHELIMDKTVKRGRLKSQGPDVRGAARISGAVCPEPSRFSALGAECPAWGPDVRPLAWMSGLWPGCPARRF